MKLTLLCLLLSFAQLLASKSFSQSTRLTLNLENVRVEEVLLKIEEKCNLYFIYNREAVDVNRKVNVSYADQEIKEVLSNLFSKTDVEYEIRGSHIILKSSLIQSVQQSIRLSGTVTDVSGSPLPGVAVSVKGTSQGTITNADGNYVLTNVSASSILVFSFVGMKTQEVSVSGRTVLNVIMEEETIGVQEVVVTALGIERNKRTLSYATQQVDMTSLTTVRDPSLGASLTGKLAGVNILTSSGTTGVGGASRIIIRGDKSIVGNNQPLIIVDGIPYNNSGGINFSRKSSTDGLSDINPDDVESINVLKGPSAAALYGSAANNGVVIVTTKKGKSGMQKAEFNSITTVDLPYLFPDFQNKYGQGAAGLFIPNSEQSWGPEMSGQQVTDWTGKETSLRPQSDNVKDFFTNGYNYTNTLSYSFGTEKSTAYFSYSNTSARSVIQTDILQKHNFNLRLGTELLPKLKMDFKVTYLNQLLENSPERGDSYFSPMHQLIRMPRSLRTEDMEVFEYFTPEGVRKQNFWNPGSTSMQNPYWAMNRSVVPTRKNRVDVFSTLRYNLTDWLYAQIRGGADLLFNDGENKVYWDSPYINSGYGDYQTQFSKNQNLTGDFLIGINRLFFEEKLSLNVTLGGEVKDSKTRFQSSTANGLSTENKFSLFYAKNPATTDSESRIQTQSLYGMAQIGYRDYLFLDVTARNDWSSTLPPPYDYFYPSFGLTGVVSDMIHLPELISFAKVRGSYAEVGAGANFANIFQTFGRTVNGPVGYIYPDKTKAPTNLKPERSKSWEAGAELRMFDNRIGIDFTWYKSVTRNQLMKVGVPPSSGYNEAWINAGHIENKGIEIVLSATPVKNKHFAWETNLNFAQNKNKVVELANAMEKYQIASAELSIGETWAIVGKPFGELYTKGFVRNDNGEVIVDATGMPKVMTSADLYLGNFNHDWTSGFSNSFNYKRWQLNFFIDLNYGGYRQSSTESQMMFHGTSKETLTGRKDGIVVPGVKEDGTVNNIKVSAEAYYQLLGGRAGSNAGEIFNHEATNSRLREFSIGYSFPMRQGLIKNITLSAVGRNLFYFYNGCGWFDPEGTYDTTVNGQGGESASLPGSRTLGFNLKVGF
ncbi:SusC/RagA family TonB-linked outer membrane protein [Gaoshiqia sp. Z1-71]|uniref:SusC/RagA family TonB-linked outer membrane protein n=1 Tax=Gaoshiqia hydrogeniformans TaxID=3290090 RepID=UPI003BF7A00B